MTGVRHSLRRTVCGLATAVLVLAMSMGATDVNADPAADALSKLNELSQQAVQSREAVTAAQRDADARLAEQAAAVDRHRADLAALEVANSQLEPYQAAVDRIAAMNYMSGRDGQFAAVLTAASPQQLIDQLSLQRTVAAGIADQLEAFQSARERAATAAQASERSAADASAAAESAAAVRAELQAKLSELLRQIAAAEAQYAALTPQQQAVVDNAAPPPPPSAPAPADPAIAAMPGLPPGDVAPPPSQLLSQRSRRRCPSASRQRPDCSPTPSWLPGPSAHGFPRYPTSMGSGRTRSRGIPAVWRSTS